MVAKTLMTVEEFMALPDDGKRYELIEGELCEVAGGGGEHGVIGMELGSRLLIYARGKRLGRVLNADTGYIIRRNPDMVRLADISFLCTERWENLERREALIQGAPDLAVEVVSPSDSYGEVHEKALVWLEAGARMVWVVQPLSLTVTVYKPNQEPWTLRAEDTLDGDDVVPGFSVPVRELFE